MLTNLILNLTPFYSRNRPSNPPVGPPPVGMFLRVSAALFQESTYDPRDSVQSRINEMAELLYERRGQYKNAGNGYGPNELEDMRYCFCKNEKTHFLPDSSLTKLKSIALIVNLVRA